MENKSKFLSPLHTRDDLRYAEPGSWVRTASFNKLATLAKNLDTSRSKNHPDKLRSVPNPWARLLLFESALYDHEHPAHEEIRDQWRGLLGVLGLADVLGIGSKLKVLPFHLSNEPLGELKEAFMALKPRNVNALGKDEEKGKWDSFSLILFDDVVLGATSPRTLVFTGIAHQCPSLIPFCSKNGRLSDPADHFRQHSPEFLSVLQQWVKDLLETIKNNSMIASWLGERPTDPTAQSVPRHQQLLDALIAWQTDIGSVTSQVNIRPAADSRLPKPYDFIKHVEEAGIKVKSDLFLKGHTDIIVGFRPQYNSFLVDAHGNQVEGQSIRVFGGYQIGAGKSLDDKFDFLPSNIRVIKNPVELFAPALIEAQIFDMNAVIYLSLERKNYLLPFREEILKYFTETELIDLARSTQLKRIDGATIRVEMNIPLVEKRYVRVFKDYQYDQSIITNDNADHPTQELAMWPDFICLGEDESGKAFFEHYFYFTRDIKKAGQVQVDFTPLGQISVERGIAEKGMIWYQSKLPLQGFIGSVGEERGLLLINHARKTGTPTRNWKVGIDFGSTHTSIFYTELEQLNGKLVPAKPFKTEPLFIKPRVRILTSGDATMLRENFFLYKADLTPSPHQDMALTTQVSMPLNRPEYYPENWLPREGQIFLGSILDGVTNKLETDLKWNIDRGNHTPGAFLRSLLVMIEAEAIYNGAQVASVAHAYPTAFPAELKSKHNNEWEDVALCVKIAVEAESLSEAVAVCRHLSNDQGALPEANVIAMDIGGSTTDIAIWTEKTLQIQESVKLAAGAVSRHVESRRVAGFREWFLKTVNEGIFQRATRFLADFSATRMGRREYHAVLKRLSENDLQENLISTIKAASKSNPEVRAFLMPIVFIFAALSYYAGMLTCKKKIFDAEQYYLYFCGKGGQLLRWIPEGEAIVQEMFIAGLLNPSRAPAHLNPKAKAKISENPKEEVGRGLLIERTLLVNDANPDGGIFAEAKATVTAAEEGYSGLAWSDNLDFERLSKIKDQVPPVKNLVELNYFIKTFSQSRLTKDVAAHLNLAQILSDSRYRDTLRERLANNLEGGKGLALIEPLFITEMKVMIELMTEQAGLFD